MCLPSGSCATMIKVYWPQMFRLAGDAEAAGAGGALGGRVVEFSRTGGPGPGTRRAPGSPGGLPPLLPHDPRAGDRRAAGAPARRARRVPAGGLGRRPVLRVRRHLLRQAARDVGGHGRRQDRLAAGGRRRDGGGLRPVVPDAPRGPDAAARGSACRCGTWPWCSTRPRGGRGHEREGPAGARRPGRRRPGSAPGSRLRHRPHGGPADQGHRPHRQLRGVAPQRPGGAGRHPGPPARRPRHPGRSHRGGRGPGVLRRRRGRGLPLRGRGGATPRRPPGGQVQVDGHRGDRPQRRSGRRRRSR